MTNQRVVMVNQIDNTRGGVQRVFVVNNGQQGDMPQASAENAGRIVQYVGQTDANFTRGYFYDCVASTTASSATATQSVGSGLTNISVDKDTLEAFTGWTTDNTLQIFYMISDWSVDPASLGITFSGTPSDGDAITVNYTAATTSYAWTRIDVQP